MGVAWEAGYHTMLGGLAGGIYTSEGPLPQSKFRLLLEEERKLAKRTVAVLDFNWRV